MTISNKTWGGGKKSPPHVATLILVAGIGSLGMNFFLPSLPSIAHHFHADYAVVQLSVSLYLMATAAFQLVLGPISDRFGRRPVLLAGFLVFLLGTLVCVTATTINEFLLGRVIQASSSAGIIVSRAAIRDLVGTTRAASMIGYVTMGMTIAPMIGPILGGYIEEYYDWHYVFFALAAFGLLAFVVTFIDFGETHHERDHKFLDQIKTYPSLLTNNLFWGYTLSAAFSSGVFFAFLGGAPYVAETHFHLQPSQYGLFFGILATGYMLGNFLSGRFSIHFGITRMMNMGAIVVIIAIATSLALGWLGFHSPLAYFGPMIGIGIGNGLTLPNAIAGMVSINPKLAGSASGLGGALQILGGALLSIWAGLVLTPEHDSLPLLYVMMFSAVIAFVAVMFVKYVDKRSSHNLLDKS